MGVLNYEDTDNMNKIFQGDVLKQLKKIETGTVNTCVTSPPYFGLRDYGSKGQIGLEQTPEAFVDKLVEVFREVRRVLRDDGTVWLNLGDSYATSTKGGTKSKPGDKNFTSKGTTGLELRSYDYGVKSKDLLGIPWRVAFALQADGWYLRQDIIWHKPNPMPESVTDRCTKAHEYIFLLSKSSKYHFDHEAIKVPVKQDWGTRDRTNGKYHNPGTGLQPHSGLQKSYTMANKRSVWSVTTKSYKGAHFATFPPDLIEPCILAGAPLGGLVLDPFMGSGTTAAVAKKLGRQYVGTELNPDYVKLAEARLRDVLPPQDTLLAA